MNLTDLANEALEDLGGTPINNIDGTERNAVLARPRVFRAIEKVQSRAHWPELVHEERLVKAGDSAWHAPRECMAIIDLNGSGRWRRAGGLVYFGADAADVRCRYVRRSIVPDEWGPFLREAIVEQLKADLAFPVSNSPELAANVKQMAEMRIKECAYQACAASAGVRVYDNYPSAWGARW